MVKVSPMIRSFNAGVFSELMEGRTDFERYPASARRMHNYVAAPQGPAIGRSGTAFVAPASDDDFVSVLVPFIFSDDQAQVLELANDRIRFVNEDGLQIYDPVASTISTQSPFVITSASLAANVDDDVVLSGYPADYNLNGEIVRVTAKAGNNYTLDKAWPAGKASVAAQVARVYHIDLDYTPEEREELRIVPSLDTIYFLTGRPVRKLLRYGAYDWRLEAVTFVDGPYLPTNTTDTTLTPSITGNAVPDMTGATVPSGVASASDSRRAFDGDGDGNYYIGRDVTWDLPETHPWHAFSSNDELYWSGGDHPNAVSDDHKGLGLLQKGWLKYDFGAAVTIDGYSILAARDNQDTTYLTKDFAPSQWKLQGSNDDATYVDIDVQDAYVLYDADKTRFFDLSKTPATYRYFKLDITKLIRNGPIDARVRRLVLRTQGRGGSVIVTSGSTIGNADANAAAAFDNVLNTTSGSCARKNDAGGATTLWIGKTLAAARAIAGARVAGSNNHGYVDRGGSTSGFTQNKDVEIRLYGKVGAAPANDTDGVLLGQINFNEGTNESTPRWIASSNTTTAYDHVWIRVSANTGEGNFQHVYVAEMQVFGWPNANSMVLTASSIVGINRDKGFQPTDVGRLIRMKGKDNYWRCLRIDGVTDTTHVTVKLEGEPFAKAEAIREWRLGLWSDTTGWPTCGDFYEDRLALAGNIEYPDYFALSRVGAYEEFQQTDEYGVVDDESAVVGRLNSRKMAGVKWLIGDEKGLLIGTASAEYILTSVKGDTEVITARNIKAKDSTSRGSSNVEPVKIDRQVLYVQRTGRTLREMAYVYEADGYKSPSMSQLASHLGVKRFKELDYAAEPYSLVWIRREDGSVVCLTYNRDENVIGWHTHDFNAVIESMTVIPAQDQMQDTLWMQTRRTVNGEAKRYIERLTRFWDFDMTIEQAHYLDCALRYEGPATKDIYGLQHLEGMEVYALADNKPQGPFTVTNGKITLAFAASSVLVGLGFDADAETSDLENGAQDGTAIGKKGRIHNASLKLWDSYGGEVGVWGDDELTGNQIGKVEYSPVEYPRRLDQTETTELFTGMIGPIVMPAAAKRCGMAFRRPKSSPLPFNVIAIMPQMGKEDRN